MAASQIIFVSAASILSVYSSMTKKTFIMSQPLRRLSFLKYETGHIQVERTNCVKNNPADRNLLIGRTMVRFRIGAGGEETCLSLILETLGKRKVSY